MSRENASTEVRLAVLIDSDNVSHDYIQPMMEEIARYGNPTIKRIYGDFTKPNLAGWKSKLLDFAISPVQQFTYTTGKNATDSSMIIDAMDILYAEKTEGFCLVSSDSDFTRLAMRLREAGKIVYGIGEKKTPNAFIAACDRFFYLEVLNEAKQSETAEDDDTAKTAEKSAGPPRNTTQAAKQKIDKRVIDLITSTIRDCEDENGWAFLGEVGSLLVKKQPSFDSRNYGFDKLTPLIRAIDRFDIDVRESGSVSSKHVYIRIRQKGRKSR